MTGAASAAITALGAFGSSFADATPTVTITAITSRMNDFMIAPFVIAFDISFAALAAVALFRSVMNTHYVGTCTSHNRK